MLIGWSMLVIIKLLFGWRGFFSCLFSCFFGELCVLGGWLVVVAGLDFSSTVSGLSDSSIGIEGRTVRSLIKVASRSTVRPLVGTAASSGTRIEFGTTRVLNGVNRVTISGLVSRFAGTRNGGGEFLTFTLGRARGDGIMPCFIRTARSSSFKIEGMTMHTLNRLRTTSRLRSVGGYLRSRS